MNAQNLWIGTSGFSYKEWKPSFYPEGLPDRQMLPYYATKLNSVEIDYTFYRMPNLKMIEAWKSAVPEGFRFALKASQQITHRQRLKAPSEALAYLMGVVRNLGDKLGVVLYQLPPFFKCDAARLESFLSDLPNDIRAAFEFRHDTWFNDQVFDLLRARNAMLCIQDSDERTTPTVMTTNATYVRLRRSEYSPAQRQEWRDRLRGWAESGIEVFAYIKHEDNPDAPRIATEFARIPQVLL